MSKQIIVLGVDDTVPGITSVRTIFWLAAPTGAQAPLPGAGSLYTNASAAELSSIQNGTVVEEQYTFHFGNSKTKAQIEADILLAFQSRQASFTTTPPGQFFGLNYDSVSGWSG